MNKPSTFAAPASFEARFSTSEFITLCEAADLWLELVDGELQGMSPPAGAHGERQATISALLWNALRGSGLKVTAGIGIDLGSDTVLVCDAAVVREIDGNRFLRPDVLLLVVEIAETTLARDMGMKRERYAAAGIPEYWVVDGVRSVIHVYREPVDGDYANVRTLRFGEPLAVPQTDQTIVIE
jgi:Uma2 family endonuclease